MSLSDKTDYEINKLVASVIYHDVDEIDQDWVNQTSGVHVIFKVGVKGGVYDWINDDALAFRLVVDNKIMMIYSNGLKKWSATHHSKGLHVETAFIENPNRAIAECYLLMSGVES